MDVQSLLSSSNPPLADTNVDTTEFQPDPTLLSQMGFSSFGTVPIQGKKRKRYNPSADAMTSASLDAESRKRGRASGANKEPVRERRLAVKAKEDSKEGLREGVGEGIGGVAGACAEVFSRSQRSDSKEIIDAGVERDGIMGGEEAYSNPGYVSSTPSPPEDPNAASISNTYIPTTVPTSATATILSLPQLESNPQNLPQKPPPGIAYQGPQQTIPSELRSEIEGGSAMNNQNTQEIEGEPRIDWAVLRWGMRNERGDMVYFDWSFLEDPWKDLK